MNAKIFVRPKIDAFTNLYLTYLPLDTIRFSLIIPPNSYKIVLSTFYAKKSSRKKKRILQKIISTIYIVLAYLGTKANIETSFANNRCAVPYATLLSRDASAHFIAFFP